MLVRALGKGCFWFPAQHERNTMKESYREVAKADQKFNFLWFCQKKSFQVPNVNYILHPWLQTRKLKWDFAKNRSCMLGPTNMVI